MKVHQKKNWFLLALLGGYSLVGPLIGGIVFTYAASQLNIEEVGLPLLSAVSFAGGILVGIALLPSFLLAGIIGFLSANLWVSTLLSTLAIGMSALIGVGLFKLVSGEATESLLSLRPGWLKMFKKLQQQKTGVLFSVLVARLTPYTPFSATNLIVSQLRVPFWPAIFVSWIGLLPRCLFACYVGSKLQSFEEITEVGKFIEMNQALLIISLVVIVLWVIKKYVLPKSTS